MSRRASVAITRVVAPGDLLALLLEHVDDAIALGDWRRPTNPDVGQVTVPETTADCERFWR